MECEVSGCIRAAFRRGLCGRHYADLRSSVAPTCSAEGCEDRSTRRGMCDRHYRVALAAAADLCGVSGCGRSVVANGLCDAHRKRRERHGHIDPRRPADWGGRHGHPLYSTWAWHRRHKHKGRLCERWADFWKFVEDVGERPSRDHKLLRHRIDDPYGPDNFYWQAPDLPVGDSALTPAKRQALYRQRHPDRVRGYRFKAAYGISVDEYNMMEERQNGLCAICGRGEVAKHPVTMDARRMAVDHCHSTGKVRALLCSSCNLGLGNFNDDPDLLSRAIEYLRRHQAT